MSQHKLGIFRGFGLQAEFDLASLLTLPQHLLCGYHDVDFRYGKRTPYDSCQDVGAVCVSTAERFPLEQASTPFDSPPLSSVSIEVQYFELLTPRHLSRTIYRCKLTVFPLLFHISMLGQVSVSLFHPGHMVQKSFDRCWEAQHTPSSCTKLPFRSLFHRSNDLTTR